MQLELNQLSGISIVRGPNTPETDYYQITLVEKEQAFARADEPERKKESKKKLQKQKVMMLFWDFEIDNLHSKTELVVWFFSFQAQASREGGM